MFYSSNSLRAIRSLASALLLSLPAACGPGESVPSATPAGVRDSAGIKIVHNASPIWSQAEFWTVGSAPLFVLRGHDGGPENRLLDPTSIDVDSRGRIIVGDGDQAGWDAILVYDSLGRFAFQAGRSGEGPGEFGQLWWASAYRGDSLVAFDMRGDVTSIFTPDGEFARSVRLPSLDQPTPPQGTFGFTAGVDAAFDDGHLLAYPTGVLNIDAGVGPSWYEHVLLRISPEGEIADTLGTFAFAQAYWDGSEQKQLWFGSWAQSAVAGDKLYFGTGERFEIGRYGPTGRLEMFIRREAEPRRVSQQMRDRALQGYMERVGEAPGANDEMLKRFEQEFRAGHFAETTPVYSAMIVDHLGYLWVQDFGEPAPLGSDRAHSWSVFDTEGTWIGDLATPPGFGLRAATADRLFGFVTDELGVTEVQAFRLDRSTGPRK